MGYCGWSQHQRGFTHAIFSPFSKPPFHPLRATTSRHSAPYSHQKWHQRLSPMTTRSNPFATRFTRPDAMPFLFPEGVDADTLLARLRHFNWRAAIVGPHGVGKSTLLYTLIPMIEQAGREVRYVALHDGERRLPPEVFRHCSHDRPVQLVVDGYEQLAPWRRWALRSWTVWHRVGLLVTAHRGEGRWPGLPILWRMEPDCVTAQRVVDYLQRDTDALIRPDDIDAALSRSQGDLREALMRLFDVHERRCHHCKRCG